MKSFLVIALAVGLVSADIGLKLRNYKVPETSYGVPSYQYSGNSDYNSGSGYVYNTPSSAQTGQYQGSTGQYQGGQYQGSSGQNLGSWGQSSSTFGGSSNTAGYYPSTAGQGHYSHGELNTINTVSPSYYQYNTGAQKAHGNYQYQSSSQYQASAAKKYEESYNQIVQQPAQVFKHFYVHAAPEEPEAPRFRQTVSLPAPQKHYKIIFIKAPSQTVYQPQYIPVPQANEEKTIVYVLSKKPEEQQPIHIPQIEQKAPSKPEVYFIKYNGKDNSESVINNIVSGHGSGDSASYASGATGQYDGASGQYQGVSTGLYQGASVGQYQGASGQYQATSGGNQGTVQYTQDVSGQYNHDSSGDYNQGGQDLTTGSVQSTSDVSSLSGYSTSVVGSSGTESSVANFGNTNTLGTSQGIPHETYGPPMFRP